MAERPDTGEVRQYSPKATDSPAQLRRVEILLNNRPRKAPDYRTPAEVPGVDRGGVTGPRA